MHVTVIVYYVIFEMDDIEKFRNTSLLSQSYIEGVKRVEGSCEKNEEEFYISQEVIDSRERTWTWLFEKFSEVPDDVELNLQTLQPDEESGSPHNSEYKLPVRKSEAQLRYWIDTGNPPCQFDEAEAEETDGTVSISESEVSELQSLSSTSMIVNKKQAISTDQLADTRSSGSSVDTATYIKTNIRATKKTRNLFADMDHRATNFANLDNNRVSRSINEKKAKVSLSRSMESPKNLKDIENNSVLRKSSSAVYVECDRDANGRSAKDFSGKGDEVIKLSHFEQSKLSNLRDSEVTFDSKESGIGSLPVQNIISEEKTEEITSSDSQNEVLKRKTSQPRMRKLYTGNNSFFDLYAPTTQSIRRNKSSRCSIHPALNSDSTEVEKKRKFRPSLLTLPKNLKARKSRLFSGNTSRARNKLGRILLSETRKLKTPNQSFKKDLSRIGKASVIVAETIKNVQICPLEKVASNLEENPPKPQIFSTDRREIQQISSPVNSSSSLSSKDVSNIINEKLYKVSRTPVVDSTKKKPAKLCDIEKILSPRSSDRQNKFTGPMLEDSRGSAFTPGAEASPETTETKMTNLLHTKKNLFATDLRSLESNDSPLSLSQSREDDVGEASPKLAYDLRKKTLRVSPRSAKRLSRKAAADIRSKILACGQSNPVVILHDIHLLKNCGGKVDNETREKRTAKRSTVDERLDKKSSRIKKSEKLSDRKRTSINKSKEENEAAIFKSVERIPPRKSIENYSFSSEEFLPYFKYDGPAIDDLVVGSNDCKERKLPNGQNITVTFSTNNREPIFDLTSSDDENIIEKLLSKSKSRFSKNKSMKKTTDETIENFVGNNKSVEDGSAIKDSKFSFVKFGLVSSGSENEEITVNKCSRPTESRKPRRKSSKRNEGKDSLDSELTIHSTRDGCSDKSEGLQHRNEKLEKQSPEVNKRLETSKGKQPLDPRGGLLAAQSEVNNGTRSHRKLRTKVRRKEDSDSEEVVSNERRSDKTRKNNEDEYCAHKAISERLKPPAIDRGLNRSPKGRGRGRDAPKKKTTDDDFGRDVKLTRKSRGSPRKKRRKSSHKMNTESANSDEREEVESAPVYKDEKKSSPKSTGNQAFIDYDGGKNSDYESENIDDAMIFSSENNAGSCSWMTGKNNDDASSTISSYTHSLSPTKRGTTVKNNVDNNDTLKEKSTIAKKKSMIIFQTKEYWESDSDNS